MKGAALRVLSLGMGLVLAGGLISGGPAPAAGAALSANALVVDGILLINRDYPIGADYDPIPGAPDNKQLLPEAQAAFQDMQEAGRIEAGLQLFVLSGYRSYAYQDWLYKGYRANVGDYADTFSAKPGMSEHQSGLAADIGDRRYPGITLEVAFENTEAGQWLANNAHRFGFILRFPRGQEAVTGYQYEPWHFRYIGKEAAGRMKAAGVPTLEAWLGTDPSAGYALARQQLGNVHVNRLPVPLRGYLIKDNHYYKLRDLARVLAGTGAAFSVDYDADHNEIILKRTPYAGGQAGQAPGPSLPYRSAFMAGITVRVDGEAYQLDRAVIDDFSYIKLRDLAKPLGFTVDWQADPPTVLISTPADEGGAVKGEQIPDQAQGPSQADEPGKNPAEREPAGLAAAGSEGTGQASNPTDKDPAPGRVG
ncbi:D-alanyl-D-alanine carboxypeptidase family protein [Peptococcus simiae]|uniref:D-alanyl-D-alanine carboxypeptidase family protein n=1 Tax=Peptococcus simiae TaxID=1643805 RepID=UPI003980FDED